MPPVFDNPKIPLKTPVIIFFIYLEKTKWTYIIFLEFVFYK